MSDNTSSSAQAVAEGAGLAAATSGAADTAGGVSSGETVGVEGGRVGAGIAQNYVRPSARLARCWQRRRNIAAVIIPYPS